MFKTVINSLSLSVYLFYLIKFLKISLDEYSLLLPYFIYDFLLVGSVHFKNILIRNLTIYLLLLKF